MKEDKLRANIKRLLHEVGRIILYALLSVAIAFLFYEHFRVINKPPIIRGEPAEV